MSEHPNRKRMIVEGDTLKCPYCKETRIKLHQPEATVALVTGTLTNTNDAGEPCRWVLVEDTPDTPGKMPYFSCQSCGNALDIPESTSDVTWGWDW